MAHRYAFFLAVVLLVVAGVFTQRMTSNVSASNSPAGKGPVVVELFTSEGCSSCPPADALLRALETQGKVEGVQVIVLGWHVDYWDRLGWKDRFSSADFTRRQQEYADVFGSEQVYTPQMVVDGKTEFVGNNERKARTTIEQASHSPKAAVSLAVERSAESGNRFRLTAEVSQVPPATPSAKVLLVLVERNLESDVRAGENQGNHLKHAGVVRSVQEIGMLTPGGPFRQTTELALDKTWKLQDLRAILLVQEPRSGSMIGAGSIPLE